MVLSDKHELKQNMSTEDEKIFGLSYYSTYITKIYKGEGTLREILVPENDTARFNPRHQKAILYTSASSGTCGVTLKKGTKYLLSGSIVHGIMKIGTCDWMTQFNHLSRQQKAGIKGGYDCSCKLDTCPVGRHCETSEDSCEWNSRTGMSAASLKCDKKHRMCRRFNGRCLWLEDSYYEPCVMKNTLKKLSSLKLGNDLNIMPRN